MRLFTDYITLARVLPDLRELAHERASALVGNMVNWLRAAKGGDDFVQAQVESWRQRWVELADATLDDGGGDSASACAWPACRRGDVVLLACAGCAGLFR